LRILGALISTNDLLYFVQAILSFSKYSLRCLGLLEMAG
jgi:hypothetical protein